MSNYYGDLGRTKTGRRRLTPPHLRKPMPSARLKTLPEEAQKRIEAEAVNSTLHQLKRWIRKEFGLEVQISTLSKFLLWRRVGEPVDEAKLIADAARDILRRDPEFADHEESVNQVCQAVFEARALSKGDSESYLALKKARQKDAELAQVTRRIDLLEAAAKKADEAEKLTQSQLSNDEYARRMREIFKRD